MKDQDKLSQFLQDHMPQVPAPLEGHDQRMMARFLEERRQGVNRQKNWRWLIAAVAALILIFWLPQQTQWTDAETEILVFEAFMEPYADDTNDEDIYGPWILLGSLISEI